MSEQKTVSPEAIAKLAAETGFKRGYDLGHSAGYSSCEYRQTQEETFGDALSKIGAVVAFELAREIKSAQQQSAEQTRAVDDRYTFDTAFIRRDATLLFTAAAKGNAVAATDAQAIATRLNALADWLDRAKPVNTQR